jgi:hypothetical protein
MPRFEDRQNMYTCRLLAIYNQFWLYIVVLLFRKVVCEILASQIKRLHKDKDEDETRSRRSIN